MKRCCDKVRLNFVRGEVVRGGVVSFFLSLGKMKGDVIDGFSVTLLSNTPHPVHENKISHFYTELPIDKECRGYWEVALLEIDFPKSWYNVPREPQQNRNFVLKRTCIKRTFEEVEAGSLDLIGADRNLKADIFYEILIYGTFKFGNYDMRDLVREMSDFLLNQDQAEYTGVGRDKNYPRCTKISMCDQSLICTLQVGIGDSLFLPEFLAKILRLDTGSVKKINLAHGESHVGYVGPCILYEFSGPTQLNTSMTKEELTNTYRTLVELSRVVATTPSLVTSYITVYQGCGVPVFPSDTSNLFIYSNIVDYECVGNVFTRLLRCVRVQGAFGDHIKESYTYPIFRKLAYDRVKDIEILIKTDDGEFVKFEYGTVMMYLYFRKLNRD